MPAIRSCRYGTVLENSPGNLGQAKGIIKLADEASNLAVRGDLGPVKFQLQAAVEIDPKSVPLSILPIGCAIYCAAPIAIIHLTIILESKR